MGKIPEEIEKKLVLIERALELLERVFDGHNHLIKHNQEGIEKLFGRIEKIEVYTNEIKKLINKVYYQEGLLQGLDRRIKELEED